MNEPSASLSSVFERFLSFEQRNDLFRMEVCGVRIWHYIRFSVYSKQVLPCFVPMGAAHPDKKARAKPRWGWNPVSVMRRLWRAFRLRVLRNPMLRRVHCDVLMALSPRITRLADGRRVRLAVDFFAGRLKSTWAVLEFPATDGGYAVHDGCGVAFCWEPVRVACAKYRRSAAFRGMQPEIADAAGRIADRLSQCFGMESDARRLTRTIENAVVRERAAVPLLRRWLRRLCVRCVVEVVHYNGDNMALTKAAHEEGIPVAELQHGTIFPAHAAYNLPVAESPCTPEYLLTWGDFWMRQMRNFPSKRAVETGYSYLEYYLERFPRRPGRGAKARILFLSQGTVGAELSRRAIELAGMLPSDRFEIVYKLHPGESLTWREIYPWLVDSKVVVVSSGECSVYELFADASAAVGVYSTAVIEGLMWGVRSFVFVDMPGGDTMKPFLVEGLMVGVSSTRELSARLSESAIDAAPSVDGSRFWTPHASVNVASAIDGLVVRNA